MKKLIIIHTMLILLAASLYAQDAALRTKQFNTTDGLAIDGYDPVAYYSQGKAVKGTKANALYHQGITYYFTSAANKDAFKKEPARYEPQYGGWCAYAMGANGEKVSIDPKTFKVTNGKLYLFYNKFFNNTLTGWNKEEAGLKRKADGNWKKITQNP